MSVLDIRTQRSPGATVLVLTGEIDRDVASALRSALAEAAQDGTPRLVADLGGVSFLDSSGLAVLVSVDRRLGVDQDLALAHVPPRLQRVLHETAMNTLLTVHELGQPWPWPDVPEPGDR